MLEDILKVVGGEVLGYAKEGFTRRIEESIEKMRTDMSETFKEYTRKSQKMMIDTAVIIAMLVIGFYYLAGGVTELMDFYSGIKGLGSLILGALFVIIAIQIYKKSQKYIES
ncbi:hypothetical protein H0O02_03470 [Candidatus Micrarchaeota archaeon]|nr:hypothetical protein [Candidatus Micrarchaeota archaeon]